MIVLSGAVARELGDERAALLRAGDLSPGPAYQCLACRQPGDLTRDRSCAVLVLGPGSMCLVWVHARCGPSEVITDVELVARFGRAGEQDSDLPAGAAADTTSSGLVQFGGVRYPALFITTGRNVRLVVDPGHMVDSAVEHMLGYGFERLDTTGAAPPVTLPGWQTTVHGGLLTEIRSPDGVWWTSDGNGGQLDQAWLDTARATREVMLVVTATSLPLDDLAGVKAAVQAAASDGRVVAAMLPVVGV